MKKVNAKKEQYVFKIPASLLYQTLGLKCHTFSESNSFSYSNVLLSIWNQIRQGSYSSIRKKSTRDSAYCLPVQGKRAKAPASMVIKRDTWEVHFSNFNIILTWYVLGNLSTTDSRINSQEKLMWVASGFYNRFWWKISWSKHAIRNSTSS